MTITICRTCAVEHDEPAAVCAICADERQMYAPPARNGRRSRSYATPAQGERSPKSEPGLHGIAVEPSVGGSASAHC